MFRSGIASPAIEIPLPNVLEQLEAYEASAANLIGLSNSSQGRVGMVNRGRKAQVRKKLRIDVVAYGLHLCPALY